MQRDGRWPCSLPPPVISLVHGFTRAPSFLPYALPVIHLIFVPSGMWRKQKFTWGYSHRRLVPLRSGVDAGICQLRGCLGEEDDYALPETCAHVHCVPLTRDYHDSTKSSKLLHKGFGAAWPSWAPRSPHLVALWGWEVTLPLSAIFLCNGRNSCTRLLGCCMKQEDSLIPSLLWELLRENCVKHCSGLWSAAVNTPFLPSQSSQSNWGDRQTSDWHAIQCPLSGLCEAFCSFWFVLTVLTCSALICITGWGPTFDG